MYTLSPFVWEDGDYHLLLRAVNRDDDASKKVARLYYGRSRDGIIFLMNDEPAIAPGPGDDDKDGCEDPTLVIAGGTNYVYYTGWNQTRLQGELLLASGPDARHLSKQGVAIAWTEERRNPKEATLVQARDGSWRLFFEFAAHDASCIGVARSTSPAGPWSVDPLEFEPRPARWDSWHLSTGPILESPNGPVMFYNGATREAHWRIGWVVFDEAFSRVVDRCTEPLIIPPSPTGDATDIAFAASAVSHDDETWLYYSVADKDMVRASLRLAS